MGWKKDFWVESLSQTFPRWERREAMTAAFLAVVALGVAGLSAIGPIKESWNVGGIIGLSVSVWLVTMLIAYLVILSPMKMWKELRDRVDAYQAIHLTVFYTESDPACLRDVWNGDKLSERLWRVGVTASKGEEVDHIDVRLTSASPPIQDLPQILHPMQLPRSTDWSHWQGDGTFRLRPGETEYVDVLRFRPEPNELELVYQSPIGKPARLTIASYRLTLTIAGNKGQAISKGFMFEPSNVGLPRFHEFDDTKDS